MNLWRSATIAATAVLLAFGAAGQPRGEPFPPPTPEPRDVPYAGVIALDVDASDVTRGIFRVRERVPVAAPGPADAALPAVAARQARAARRDQSAVGNRDPRERRAARVAPRSRQRVRVPRRRAGRRRRARPHVPVRVADAGEPRPHRRDARDAESAVGGGVAVSGGPLRVANSHRAEPEAACRAGASPLRSTAPARRAIRRVSPRRTWRRSSTRRCSRVSTTGSSISTRAPRARASQHLRRPARSARSDRRAARRAPQSRAASVSAVRLAALRSLRLPVRAHGPDGRHRPRASSLERERRRRHLLHRLERAPRASATCCRTRWCIRGTASSAAPRICGRRTTRRRCAAACCGSTKGSRSTTASCSPRAPACGRTEQTRDALALTAATYQYRVGRAVALRGRHDQRSDPLGAPAGAVAQLAAQRGLLLGGSARVARCRYVDPRAHQRPPLARRFRAGVLRHQRRLVGARDLHVRGHRGRAERRARPRLGDVPARAHLRQPAPSRRSTAWRAAATGSCSRRSAARSSAKPRPTAAAPISAIRWGCVSARTATSRACNGTARRSIKA